MLICKYIRTCINHMYTKYMKLKSVCQQIQSYINMSNSEIARLSIIKKYKKVLLKYRLYIDSILKSRKFYCLNDDMSVYAPRSTNLSDLLNIYASKMFIQIEVGLRLLKKINVPYTLYELSMNYSIDTYKKSNCNLLSSDFNLSTILLNSLKCNRPFVQSESWKYDVDSMNESKILYVFNKNDESMCERTYQISLQLELMYHFVRMISSNENNILSISPFVVDIWSQITHKLIFKESRDELFEYTKKCMFAICEKSFREIANFDYPKSEINYNSCII